MTVRHNFNKKEDNTMIRERFMVKGKRLDNGKIVQGYYFRQLRTSGSHEDKEALVDVIETAPASYSQTCFEVDPNTIEPVAIKVINKKETQEVLREYNPVLGYKKIGYIIEAECPNCGRTVRDTTNLPMEDNIGCRMCLQRLDWRE